MNVLRNVCLGVLVLAAGAVRGQTNGAMPAVVLDRVAAYVNEHAVTVSDVLQVIQPVQRQLMARYGGEELKARLGDAYRAGLESLIARKLILEAAEAENLQLPDWVVENRVTEIIADQFEGDRMALMDALARDRLTYDEWRDEIRQHLVVQYMRAMHVDQKVSVGPLDVRRAYEENLEAYRTPAQVKVRTIMLSKGDTAEAAAGSLEKARRVLERIAAGEDFAMVARDISEGPAAGEGGERDWMAPEYLHSALAEAAERLAPGEVSGVIETDRNLYVLKLEGRKEASVQPFAAVQPEIEARVRAEKSEALYDAWIDRLRQQAYVKVVVEDPF
ncbi:MAG: peptidyl-prolyl cis-trans isomerase [Lentisphaerae bacterium]|nr:peptidyl-prolyl cis-trans isomerase [Lentisphaerota bacterium]